MTTKNACESLNHNGSKIYSCKIQFREKNLILPFEKVPFLVLARNTYIHTYIHTYIITHSLLHYLSTGRLREVKNKEKLQTFSYKSGRGCLQEVVAYERWSLTRGGRLGEVVA